jgi:AIPR protein
MLTPALLIDSDVFRREWLADITEGSPSNVELGRRFAFKIVTQWLDGFEPGTDLVYCDGAGDGGIDLAHLDRADEANSDEASGDTWYLIQSKYGSAFKGTSTLLAEGQKVIDTLDGRRDRLSSLAEGLLDRLQQFCRNASERDRIVLTFATETALDDEQRRALNDLRAMGRERLGPLFDVEAISIETILQRLREAESEYKPKVKLDLVGHFVQSGPDLLVGSVRLTNLYKFLKNFRDQTQDLDQLYERNVRKFLGARGKVNKAIASTLREAPEKFGLYNNGITIVTADYGGDDFATTVGLSDPFIVNGCQTTRSIWEVFHRKLDAGGTGSDPELDDWKKRAEAGVVVVKIAKVGSTGELLSQAITRFTNSQNAVREKDFLALTGDFRTWQAALAEQHSLYLEIQRGGWDSQRGLQKQNPAVRQFSEAANAADLIKVYGAGWLGEAGMAFGKNPPFLPGGIVFKRIIEPPPGEGDGAFGADDLWATYLLQKAADEFAFGRGADQASRRQTRFLFYMVAIDLLKEVIVRPGRMATRSEITHAVVTLLEKADCQERQEFLDRAIDAIDSYMTKDTDNSIFDEPAFTNTYNNDLNGFLKWEQIGKSETNTPRFRQLLSVAKGVMGTRAGSPASLRDRIKTVLYPVVPDVAA